MIRGVLFDLDNTLVDSGLDFEAMRREMELPPGRPILEAIEQLAPLAAARCREILRRHELAGAARATLLPGVRELVAELVGRAIRFGIATRNSREIASRTLANVGLACDLVLTRDCGPVKPDPWAVRQACEVWGVPPSEVVVVGDYKFDIESGRRAGAPTVLLIHQPDPAAYPNSEQADLVLSSLADYPRLLAWFDDLAAEGASVGQSADKSS
jgi:HAD superfamily hydrolase (TIGR01509 family)